MYIEFIGQNISPSILDDSVQTTRVNSPMRTRYGASCMGCVVYIGYMCVL